MKSYSEKAKEARKMLGYTQVQLAKKLGMSGQGSIARIEAGHRQYGKQKENALIKLTGLPYNYFFDEDCTETNKLDNRAIVLAMIPEIEAAGLTIEILREMLKPLVKHKTQKEDLLLKN